MKFNHDDQHWMQQALALARQAQTHDEVPVGAVVVLNNEIIGAGCNQPIATHDPTAHAEIIALRQAAQNIGNYRLLDTTLYVTLEPCLMCAGAMIHARIKRLVYATDDPKTGAIHSVFNILTDNKFNHVITVDKGILAAESSALLKEFFLNKRINHKCLTKKHC